MNSVVYMVSLKFCMYVQKSLMLLYIDNAILHCLLWKADPLQNLCVYLPVPFCISQ